MAVRRILGIDPGLASTGVGVIERQADGSWRALGWRQVLTRESQGLPERLAVVHGIVAESIRAFAPDLVGIESIFFAKNVRSAVLMAHGRGAAILAAANSGARLVEYAPREVKLLVTGSGRATKEAIGRMVRLHLGLAMDVKIGEHAADALAVALCAGMRESFAVRTGVGLGEAKKAAPVKSDKPEPAAPLSEAKHLLKQAFSRRTRRRTR